jgi:hypothetical protein
MRVGCLRAPCDRSSGVTVAILPLTMRRSEGWIRDEGEDDLRFWRVASLSSLPRSRWFRRRPPLERRPERGDDIPDRQPWSPAARATKPP